MKVTRRVAQNLDLSGKGERQLGSANGKPMSGPGAYSDLEPCPRDSPRCGIAINFMTAWGQNQS